MNLSRRQFLKASTAFAGLNILPSGVWANSPNGKFCTAHIGIGGKGGSDLGAMASHGMTQIVGLSDVDSKALTKYTSNKKYKDAAGFADYREMLTSLGDKIDGVVVSTPDHTHHPAALMAMKMGKHIYCQKPLTHEIAEAYELMRVAREKQVVTQMGIQVHASTSYRMAVRFIQSGIIGKVSKVYAWSSKSWGNDKPDYTGSDPVTEGLAWDLWLGTAPARPFLNKKYHPNNWRRIIDFGCGTLGDMGVHIIDTPYAALKLTYPKSVKVTCREPNGISHPQGNVVEYEFPSTEYTTDKLQFTWYDGKTTAKLKEIAELTLPEGKKLPNQGAMFIGEDGKRMLLPHVGAPQPIPRELLQTADITQPEKLNHYHQWVDASMGKGTCGAGFDYAGPLTVGVLLGVVGNRFPGQKLEWDGANMRFKNNDAANRLVSRKQRTDY